MSRILIITGLLSIACLAADLPAAALAQATNPDFVESELANTAERKTVTVYADNTSEATARAEKQHPGWKVVDIKKVNPKDPISRMYLVTMEK
jgi:hypothetical protein